MPLRKTCTRLTITLAIQHPKPRVWSKAETYRIAAASGLWQKVGSVGSKAGIATTLPGRTGKTSMADSHGRFIWYELTTTDMRAAKTFYATVVGWGTRDASMAGLPYTVFTAGEDSVSGVMELPKNARKMGERPMWI